MKRAITIKEQIAKLRNRGVIISNEQKAEEVLLDIGYFRLCSYFFPFEESYPEYDDRTHQFVEGTTFEDAVALYYFDFDLRHILIRYISRIEVAFRTYLTYYVSNKYNEHPNWFVNEKIVSTKYAKSFRNEVYTDKFKLNPVIKRHHRKHPGKYAPAWKTIEYMTFGAVLYLYCNLNNNDDKIAIAKQFNIKQVTTFSNYLETLRVVRNACAHGNVLFDLRLPKSIRRGPAGKMTNENKYILCGMLKVLYYMIGQVSTNRAKEMQENVQKAYKTLEEKAPNIYQQIVEITGYNALFVD